MPVGAPRKSSTGSGYAGFSATVISYSSRVVRMASTTEPPTNRTIAGAPAIANPPSPAVSVIAESPMSGLASSDPYPPRNSPCGTAAGPVNQASPVPASWMPKSVPLRAIAVTTVAPGIPAAAAVCSLAAGITRLRKKWSLPPMNRATRATSPDGKPLSTRWGSRSRSSMRVPARLRLCPSSPMASICPTIALTSTGPCTRTAARSAGPSTAPIQRSRSITSGA